MLASRYPKMAARLEHTWVLAVTTSARPSAILHSKNSSCTGIDMTTERTSGVDATPDGYDPTRHDLSRLATGPDGWIQIANVILMGCW